MPILYAKVYFLEKTFELDVEKWHTIARVKQDILTRVRAYQTDHTGEASRILSEPDLWIIRAEYKSLSDNCTVDEILRGAEECVVECCDRT